MTLKKLYIDIDGVLIAGGSPYVLKPVLAGHAVKFLRFSLDNFDCYWLTSHCRHGETSHLIAYLETTNDPKILELSREVKPTSWSTLKTEAIDLTSDFYWIDDSPLQYEIELLKSHGVLERWIHTNTRKDPDGLLRVMEQLKRLQG